MTVYGRLKAAVEHLPDGKAEMLFYSHLVRMADTTFDDKKFRAAVDDLLKEGVLKLGYIYYDQDQELYDLEGDAVPLYENHAIVIHPDTGELDDAPEVDTYFYRP